MRRAVHPRIRQVLAQSDAVFSNLDSYGYLSDQDKRDFLWYGEFFRDALLDIDWRITRGDLKLLEDASLPCPSLGSRRVEAALFIGSFDPFQMTHLAMALRYLASPRSNGPVVYVVAEGHRNPNKPSLSEYSYRFDLIRMQLEEPFRQLLVPLDIGKGADTVEIFRRFIRLHEGKHLSVTHIVGSDVLPYATRMLPSNLEAWEAEAEACSVDFKYGLFVLRRDAFPVSQDVLRALDRMDVSYVLDERELQTPSSTDFRSRNAFSIVYPTPEIIRHLEVVFRYRLNRSWRDGPEQEGTD